MSRLRNFPRIEDGGNLSIVVVMLYKQPRVQRSQKKDIRYIPPGSAMAWCSPTKLKRASILLLGRCNRSVFAANEQFRVTSRACVAGRKLESKVVSYRNMVNKENEGSWQRPWKKSG